VFGTLDGYVIALNAISGKEIWVVKHAHPIMARPSRGTAYRE
jgi:outer membrane protein assembly factor BamB